jgi:hypothetical protein
MPLARTATLRSMSEWVKSNKWERVLIFERACVRDQSLDGVWRKWAATKRRWIFPVAVRGKSVLK